MRLFTALFFIVFSLSAAQAQERPGIFKDYESFSDFLDQNVTNREIIQLMEGLGGGDEYSDEQLQGMERNVLSLFPRDFENKSVFNEQDLGGGVLTENRLYWTGDSYLFMSFILHNRDGEIAVLNFKWNSNITQVM